ncbi:glycosyltransferase family 32 protein [Vibrio navarrensis]
MIPKVIHYIWFGRNQLPIVVLRCIESWKKYAPDFEIKVWNEDNIPRDIPFVEEMLKEKKWAFASDYMRLHLIYNFGGIYLDTDIELVKNIEPLLANNCFLGYESKGRPTTGIFGAVKGHPLILTCIKIMENRYTEKLPYFIAPEVATEAVKINPTSDFFIYPEDCFYPYNPYDTHRNKSILMYSDVVENTFAIHHWNHGWHQSVIERLLKKMRKLIFK